MTDSMDQAIRQALAERKTGRQKPQDALQAAVEKTAGDK